MITLNNLLSKILDSNSESASDRTANRWHGNFATNLKDKDLNFTAKLILFKNWKKIVGTLNTHICLEKVEGNIAIIGVYEAHWMQELYLMSNLLLKLINSNFDSKRITAIKFRLKAKGLPKFNNNFSLINKSTNNNLANNLSNNSTANNSLEINNLETNFANNNSFENIEIELGPKQKIALEKITDPELKKYLLGYYARIHKK